MEFFFSFSAFFFFQKDCVDVFVQDSQLDLVGAEKAAILAKGLQNGQAIMTQEMGTGGLEMSQSISGRGGLRFGQFRADSEYEGSFAGK